MILADDWAGHRHPITGEKFGDRDEWTSWDHYLVSAYATIEANTDSHGLFRWETSDEAVYVDAIRKIDKFEEAKHNLTSGSRYKPLPGEYFVPQVKTRRSGGKLRTFQEYMDEEIAKTRSEATEE